MRKLIPFNFLHCFVCCEVDAYDTENPADNELLMASKVNEVNNKISSTREFSVDCLLIDIFQRKYESSFLPSSMDSIDCSYLFLYGMYRDYRFDF